METDAAEVQCVNSDGAAQWSRSAQHGEADKSCG